jgi:hypothetical protein
MTQGSRVGSTHSSQKVPNVNIAGARRMCSIEIDINYVLLFWGLMVETGINVEYSTTMRRRTVKRSGQGHAAGEMSYSGR